MDEREYYATMTALRPLAPGVARYEAIVTNEPAIDAGLDPAVEGGWGYGASPADALRCMVERVRPIGVILEPERIQYRLIAS